MAPSPSRALIRYLPTISPGPRASLLSVVVADKVVTERD